MRQYTVGILCVHVTMSSEKKKVVVIDVLNVILLLLHFGYYDVVPMVNCKVLPLAHTEHNSLYDLQNLALKTWLPLVGLMI